MPSITRRLANANLVVGQVESPIDNWQYVNGRDFNARLDVGVVVTDAQTAAVIDLFSGSDLLASRDEIQLAAAVIWPDNYYYSDVIGRGERIGLSINPTTVGVAGDVIVSVRLTPLGS